MNTSKVLIESEAAYKQKFPKKYAMIRKARQAFEELFPGEFPDAFCPKASEFLFTHCPDFNIMNGRFQNNEMLKSAYHVWVFDMVAKVHIDITADQFPTHFGTTIAIVPAGGLLSKLGYSLGSLETFETLATDSAEMKNIADPAKDLISNGPKRYMSDVEKRFNRI
jgi:hypothetical protein